MIYEEELLEWRAKFNAEVDINDRKSVRKWFKKYPHLTSPEHAQIIGKNKDWVCRLREWAGLKEPTPKHKPPIQMKKAFSLQVPENWDTAEWLTEAYKHYGSLVIARAVKRSKFAIRTRLKKLGLKPPKRPSHPLCNKNWVYDHYVVKGLTQKQCAALAGIPRQSFVRWLVKLQIPIRGHKRGVGLWIKQFIYELEQLDIVRHAYYRPDHIHVRFRDYRWVSYYFKKMPYQRKYSHNITKEDCRLSRIPAVVPQYESALGTSQYPAHITIRRDQWKKANMIERHIALHKFCDIITKRGWIWPCYPPQVLQKDLELARSIKESDYVTKKGFSIYGAHSIIPATCRKILYHYFNPSEFWETLISPRKVMLLLTNLASRGAADQPIHINTHNLLRTAAKHQPLKIPDPMAYVCIFRRLQISGTILDLTPGHGSRAVAAALCGIRYMTAPNEKMQHALQAGIVDFLGLDYSEYDGSVVDLTICDNDFTKTTAWDQLKLDNTRNLLIFVKSEDKDEMLNKLRPKKIIPIRTEFHHRYCNRNNYLFLY